MTAAPMPWWSSSARSWWPEERCDPDPAFPRPPPLLFPLCFGPAALGLWPPFLFIVAPLTLAPCPSLPTPLAGARQELSRLEQELRAAQEQGAAGRGFEVTDDDAAPLAPARGEHPDPLSGAGPGFPTLRAEAGPPGPPPPPRGASPSPGGLSAQPTALEGGVTVDTLTHVQRILTKSLEVRSGGRTAAALTFVAWRALRLAVLSSSTVGRPRVTLLFAEPPLSW